MYNIIETEDFNEPETKTVHSVFYSGSDIDAGRNLHKLDRITVDPEVRQGKPCIRGMRIPVSMILGMLIYGYSEEEILKEFPMLEKEDILQSKNYAYVLCGGYYDSIGH